MRITANQCKSNMVKRMLYWSNKKLEREYVFSALSENQGAQSDAWCAAVKNEYAKRFGADELKESQE